MADRGMTAGMDTAMTGAVKHPILLAKFIFDTGDLNLWNGIGDSPPFNGDVYTGTGALGGVSPGVNVRALEFHIPGTTSALARTLP